jgi:hypothetical protein
MPQKVSIAPGMRFGRLIVLARAPKKHGDSHIQWLCGCDCGQECSAASSALRVGRSISCGCRASEVMALGIRFKHGCADTPEYNTWKSMVHRCTNQKTSRWGDYGGRGIVVCERWQSFENFLADMGMRPSARHSLDRVNVHGNYEPGNCRWATIDIQARNTSRTAMLTFNGTTQCVADWATDLGVYPQRLRDRLKAGWSVEKTLTTPSAAPRQRR